VKHSHCLSLSRTQRIDALITGLSYSRLFPDLPAFAAEEGFLIAYYILECTIIAKEGRQSLLARAVGKDWKGKLSPALYVAAIPLSFASSWIASALYALAALIWLIPDSRIERELKRREE